MVDRPTRVIWQPQPGPQLALLNCPIREICFGGARGGGKTDGMLGHFLDFKMQYGGKAQGIFFRKRYKDLDRVKERGKELFCAMGARFLESKDTYWFVWPDGARLLLRTLKTPDEAEQYQGHEYPWMCFEELTQWPTPALIDKVRAANRNSSHIPNWFLSTCNPGGVGHQWVKDRYIAACPAGYLPIKIEVSNLRGDETIAKDAVFLPSKVWDNRKLLDSDPDYIKNLYLSGPEWLVRAWLNGDWDIIAGGYLEGVWKPERHIIDPFTPSPTWPRFRAMDWGFASPYSIGWYTVNPDTKQIIRYRELYGYGGKPNVGTRQDALEVRGKVLEMEQIERKAGIEFRKNPADRTIWNKIGTQKGINDLFMKGQCVVNGEQSDLPVRWIKGENGPGSREINNQIVVSALANDQFAVTSDCKHFLRTVPTIPADEDNLEDVDTEAEDHAYDEFKMALASRRNIIAAQAAQHEGPKPFSGNWIERVKDGRYIPPKPVRG